jgi:hypothetical protein
MASPARIGLVGSGVHLTRAIEAFQGLRDVTIEIIADVTGGSEGARLARGLGITVVSNPMSVFRSSAEVILEVNGEERVYERLLAVKPPRIEVVSARGVRLLLDFLTRGGGEVRGAPRIRVTVVVAADQPDLYEYLARGLAGLPGLDVVLDRRRRERRQQTRATATERRRGERRRVAVLSADLGLRGFAIIRASETAT